MADLDPITTTVAAVSAALAGAGAAGWTGNHVSDIARSWADGCQQLAVWRTAARARFSVDVAGLLLVVLPVVLPAHGAHRREVTG